MLDDLFHNNILLPKRLWHIQLCIIFWGRWAKMGQGVVRKIDEPQSNLMIFSLSEGEGCVIQNFQFLLRTLLICFPLPTPVVYRVWTAI